LIRPTEGQEVFVVWKQVRGGGLKQGVVRGVDGPRGIGESLSGVQRIASGKRVTFPVTCREKKEEGALVAVVGTFSRKNRRKGAKKGP